MKGFTGQDVFDAFQESYDLVVPGDTDSNDALAIVLNKNLPALIEAEIERRLSEAETVYGEELYAMGETWIRWGEAILNPVRGGPNPNNYSDPTHKAKLLAITPIGEPWPWEKK